MTDDQIYYDLMRGGHDQRKVYAAYERAVNSEGRPTIILMHTVKGYGMGESGEALNISHQQKKMGEESVRAFRDRFKVPVADEDLAEMPYYHPCVEETLVEALEELAERLDDGRPLVGFAVR